MEYILLCAPGGCGFKQATEKLVWVLRTMQLPANESAAVNAVLSAPALSPFEKALEETDHWPTLRKVQGKVAHRDVEDVLCGLAELDREFRSAGYAPPGTPNMRDVTWNLTRDRVIELWRRALDESLNHLSLAPVDDSGGWSRVLTCHLTLYGGRRREFYSPLSVAPLIADGRFRLTHVLLFLDDVYDMYARLASEGHLYDAEEELERYLGQLWYEEGHRSNMAFGDRLRARLSLEWQVSVLTVLLAWRRSEMLLAEALARQVGAKYLVFGTKQEARVAGRWLLDREARSVYLSHPISRPRRFWRTHQRWPEVVNQFNDIQGALAERGVVSVMPTAIDEYRIEHGQEKPISYRRPVLEARWPLGCGRPASLYSLPEGFTDYEHTYVLTTNPRLPDKEVDLLLRQLENQIKLEVPFRDHYLVACNPSILVFRPLYERGQESQGVRAELEHWKALARSDTTRRAVLIHFQEDLARALHEPRGAKKEILGIAAGILSGPKYGLPRDVALELASAEGRAVPPTLLDGGRLPSYRQITKAWPTVLKEAQEKWIWSLLTVVDLPPEQTGIWTLSDNQELLQQMEEIGAFLAGGRDSTGGKWQETASMLMHSHLG